MIRALIEELLLFLLPFGLFALYLVLRRRNVLQPDHWSDGAAWLAMSGLGIVLAGFLYKGFIADRPETGFQPTHIEDGRVVPGRFR